MVNHILSHGHNPSYVQVLASACCLRVKTWENVGKICGSARGEYGLSTDLGARRHAVEILVHAELSLRSGYGFTPSTDDAGTSTANVRTTYSLREFFTIFPMVTCSTDGVLSTCVVRAWSVRGPCLFRTSQVQLSNEQTELTWTVPSKHVLRTYNALIWRAGHVLTTCATVRLTCVYILPLCSCHSLTTFSEKNVAGLASPKNVRKIKRRMGCARGFIITHFPWS